MGKKAMKESLKTIDTKKGKRHLVEVLMLEGSLEDLGAVGKKRKQDVEMKEASTPEPEVVLDDKHRLAQ